MKELIRYLLVFGLVAGKQSVLVLLAATQSASLEAYRRHALTHEGDVVSGKKLFNNEERLLCSKCHSVDGSASKAGPDLFAVGDAFGRRDLIEAVLRPSAAIAPGYGTVTVETREGDIFQGTLKQSTDAGIQLMGADGKLASIPNADIKERSGSSVSLMPEGLEAGLSPREFTDLVEYLTTLRQPESTLASNQGAPGVIASLEKPVRVRPFFTNSFELPPARVQTGLTALRQVPGRTNDFLILHQKGMVWRVEKSPGREERAVFADLTAEVFSERGPNGLQDLAFHPRFRENRKYYLFYQALERGTVTTQIVEREFEAGFKRNGGKPGRVLLSIPSVAEDHSGGCLQFGPDGYLYVVMGDTGPHNDPNGHAQNLELLLGKLLRLDVNSEQLGKSYAIPKDNPFVGRGDARPEIWAYGFRNPWRFSFDRITGDLWLADVGQDRAEEVHIVHQGGNYGWNVFEGFEPFSNQHRKEGRTFVAPVFAYRRQHGNSITGGFVYRGDKNSSFYGVYLCGDFTSKRIFGLTQEKGVLKTVRQIGAVPQGLVSFGENAAGDIYVVGYEGAIYQIDFTEARFE